jgi:hypothetical protein
MRTSLTSCEPASPRNDFLDFRKQLFNPRRTVVGCAVPGNGSPRPTPCEQGNEQGISPIPAVFQESGRSVDARNQWLAAIIPYAMEQGIGFWKQGNFMCDSGNVLATTMGNPACSRKIDGVGSTRPAFPPSLTNA